ncbi:MAG: CDP-glycerol glycerophosphotransferase family protein, partial [Mobilitalea sp.]
LKYIDNINAFFAKKQLKLMLTVSSLGIKNCLILDYCHKKNISTYNVLNGLLVHTFYEEDNKNFSWINSYGEFIKKNYYHNADNVVCLGDPRLDSYANDKSKKDDCNFTKRLLIGTTGFSIIDLNSYRAVEFGYFNNILSACKILKERGVNIDISIKLHPQCDRRQYIDFLNEYFSDFPVKLYDGILMGEALRRTDCYISSCSGTVFEASLLGVSVLYYKMDSEVLIAPYDAKSELVTALSAEDLLSKIELLCKNDAIFNTFKDKNVMERYVGPLDGKNTDRNVEFIYSLMG